MSNNNALKALETAFGCTKEEVAEPKRKQRDLGRSRLAQFGKTFTDCQCAKPLPYWLRIRSFCVRSAYAAKRCSFAAFLMYDISPITVVWYYGVCV